MTAVKKPEGKKLDSGKMRWDLVPWRELEEIVKVITFGAEKYDPNNWKLVENARERYFAAILRHLTKWRHGEKKDPETGIHNLAHAGCNILFLLWFECLDISGKVVQ